MLRSVIRSTIAFTWPLPSATLLVIVTVPLEVSVTTSVAVPAVGAAVSGVALNRLQAAISKAFLELKIALAVPDTFHFRRYLQPIAAVAKSLQIQIVLVGGAKQVEYS